MNLLDMLINAAVPSGSGAGIVHGVLAKAIADYKVKTYPPTW